MGSPVVVDKLSVHAGNTTLVEALSFRIQPGEVLALIGESGSGKTTTALALMGHARRGCRISGGSVRIGDVDVLALAPRQLRALRGRTVAYIAQSAAASFDPSRSVLDQVVEPACLHGMLPRGEAELKAIGCGISGLSAHRDGWHPPGLRISDLPSIPLPSDLASEGARYQAAVALWTVREGNASRMPAETSQARPPRITPTSASTA